MSEKHYIATIYRNLRKGVWSIRFRGKVRHFAYLMLDQPCWTHINEAQQEVARKEGVRNVHAFVKTYLTEAQFNRIRLDATCPVMRLALRERLPWMVEVRYSPFRRNTSFFEKKEGKRWEKITLLRGAYFSDIGKLFTYR